MPFLLAFALFHGRLDKLFDAIGGKDRETILKGLKEAKVGFKTR